MTACSPLQEAATLRRKTSISPSARASLCFILVREMTLTAFLVSDPLISHIRPLDEPEEHRTGRKIVHPLDTHATFGMLPNALIHVTAVQCRHLCSPGAARPVRT